MINKGSEWIKKKNGSSTFDRLEKKKLSKKICFKNARFHIESQKLKKVETLDSCRFGGVK